MLFSGLVLLYMVKLYQWISGGPKTKGLGASFNMDYKLRTPILLANSHPALRAWLRQFLPHARHASTWVKLGLCFPLTYMDAFLSNSVGYWYLADTTHAQIYGIGTESGFGYLSTDNRTMPAGCEIVEHSYLPGLRAFMERIVSDNVMCFSSC